ncbi:MAG: RluA family pseudouridine synthase [Corallococcus sp.]|nr:RluA family pseudouridine synthase [Corallococcus sp.]MCM1359432.1 RluA family pseudouridine synthase [Corallococcus sp.]MCM1394756.1 RluA family pseudouridine synthase [Corallococcus sp.]
MKTVELTADTYCRRLDVFLSDNAGLTRSRAQKLIEQGCVLMDGKVAMKVSSDVKENCAVTVNLPDEIPLDVLPQDIPLDIVYQDGDLAVVNKQQGLTVHPANGVFEDTLVNALLFHVKDLSGINGVLRPGIVHRLDKDTSGLLVVAKNDAAHLELQRQIQTKQCRRIYWALLEGVIKQDDGVVDRPVGRSKSDRKKMDVVADGRSAQTFFKVLRRYKNYSLVQFELKTGRTHQIRVHAKFLGHPVVGDKTYGYKNCKWNLAGQLLHAQTLIFTHPTTGKEMAFSAPLPDYFQKVLDILDKTN